MCPPVVGAESSSHHAAAAAAVAQTGDCPPRPTISPCPAFSAKYYLSDIIGHGSFSKVYACVRRSTGKHYAVKVAAYGGVPKGGDPAGPTSSNSLPQRNDMLRELNIMKRLRGAPGALQIRDCFDDRLDDKNGRMYIVTDLARGGDLLAALAAGGVLSEGETKAVMQRLVRACEGLHLRGVVHRDVKLENILLDDAADVTAGLKLSDVGLAARLEDGLVRDVCGTPLYVAPEVLSPQRLTDPSWGYGKEVDMWSCGVVMYCLLSGAPPFTGETMQDIFYNIRHGRVFFAEPCWATVSPLALDFLCRCLTLDPTARVTATQALQHPWMKTV